MPPLRLTPSLKRISTLGIKLTMTIKTLKSRNKVGHFDIIIMIKRNKYLNHFLQR